MKYAEVAGPADHYRTNRTICVPDNLVPDHVYCDTCGDCIICTPHDPESWCVTGARWVLYTDYEDDMRIITAVESMPARPEAV